MARGFHTKTKKGKGGRNPCSTSDPDLEEFMTSTSHHSGYYSRKMASSKGRGKLNLKKTPKRHPHFDPVHDNPSLRSFRTNRLCEHHDHLNMGQNKRGKKQIFSKPSNQAPKPSNSNQNMGKHQNRPPKIYNAAHPNSYRTAWIQANSVPYNYVDSSDEEINSDLVEGEETQPHILTQVERVPNSDITDNPENLLAHGVYPEETENNSVYMDGLIETKGFQSSTKYKPTFNYPEVSEESFKIDGFYIDTIGNQEYSPNAEQNQEAIPSHSKKVDLSLDSTVINLVSDEMDEEGQDIVLPEIIKDLTQKDKPISTHKAIMKITSNDDLLQDYIDSMDVEDLNLKLNECKIMADQTEGSDHFMEDSGDESGNTSYDERMIHDSDFGSDMSESEEYYRGFNEGVMEGLSFVLDNLTKNQRLKMEEMIRTGIPLEMHPVCLSEKTSNNAQGTKVSTKGKKNKLNLNVDKHANVNQQKVIEITNADMNEANAAILEMLHNKYRKAILFPTQNKVHFQSIRALSLAYKLRVVQTSTSAGSRIRAEKIPASRVPRDKSDINQLLEFSKSNRKATDFKFTKKTTKFSENVVSSGTPIPSSNVGHKLLSKMGWTPGQALGASGTGILEPILPEMRKKNQGLGA